MATINELPFSVLVGEDRDGLLLLSEEEEEEAEVVAVMIILVLCLSVVSGSTVR